ncbi:MAG: glucose-6-phosphate dehydrogenase [Lentisphaerae bacterium]|nr:glucose-6-phosphate dehydrogenase [Lentisphaerota bacterium]
MKAYMDRPLSIVVIGASGDLAHRKLYPALFGLYAQGYLPERFAVFGFARSAYTHEGFREHVAERLTCRYTPQESCGQRVSEFLQRCWYIRGEYGSSDAFLDLYQAMKEVEGAGEAANRLYYLAIPPSLFLATAHALGGAGMVQCGLGEPWSRVVLEKPFGRDSASSARLTREMAKVFTEAQTYRIDHYLGKEVIQNMLVLRFANLVFEPVWNRNYIASVAIEWKEDMGIEKRGYFDDYGIIRDVMQNHLLQILALAAMEPPGRLDSKHIRDEKVQVLRNIPPLTAADVVVGQYTGTERNGRRIRGYTEEDAVADDSLTPTFAAATLRIRNRRWDGVPFRIRAGKALDERVNEIRVRFKDVPGNLFTQAAPPFAASVTAANEMVIRVQPDEAITLRIVNKVPGVGMQLAARDLDLEYKAAFSEPIPDAYEDLLLDVFRGEKGLFIRSDELEAAWEIFTPVLHELETKRIKPAGYAFGSRGPETG